MCSRKDEDLLQRTSELGVLEVASAVDVRVIRINALCMFGRGTDLFMNQELVILLVI